MRTRTKLSRNGTRHPQVSKASGLGTPVISRIIAVDRSSPIGTPSCGKLAISPLRWLSPHSIDMRTEPPHSPPTPMPWAMRKRVSRIGAATPMVA